MAESLEYLEHTKDPDTLGKARREAVRRGDAFSLARACQILRAEPAPEEWRELAANAGAAGRFLDAVNALERAGDADGAEALRAAGQPEPAVAGFAGVTHKSCG